MKRIITAYDMMISSPSDTREEVEAVFESVADFNRQTNYATMIRILRWSSDVSRDSNKAPQESINEQIVKDCDFAVAIFKSRLGKKVGDDESGTAQEIRLFREQGKRVYVFCLARTLENKDKNGNQTELQRYIEKLIKEDVWVGKYTDAANLRSEVLNQLQNFELWKDIPDLAKVDDLKIRTIDLGQSGDAKMNKNLENATCVKIFHTTGNNFFKAHVDQLTKMLRKGGTLKVLLPNPESEFLHDVDLVEGRSTNNPISGEFGQTISYLGEIWREAKKDSCDTAGKIWIGCAHTMLRQTETICINSVEKDGRNTMRIWSWVTVTMPPKRASGHSMSLESETLEKGDGSLADLANTNFDRSWEESDIKIEFSGNEFPYFYMEKPHAKELWRKLTKTARDSADRARKRDGGVLIEVAAQHPLKSDGTPGEEFSRRLDMGIELYHKVKNEGKRCRIYVPGSLHMHEGIEDKLSLSESGKDYLREHGIPVGDIYGNTPNAM